MNARVVTVTVELGGLPALVVSGEPCPPEPDVGISWWVVDQLDWRGAHGDLTPEQDLTAYEHSRELEDAVVEAFHERRAAERSAREADGEAAMSSARQTTVVVKLDGLPELLVSGEPWEPEFDIGIDHWTVVDLDWRGAHGDLTPEQDVAALAHSRELEDAVIEAFHERRAADHAAIAEGAL